MLYALPFLRIAHVMQPLLVDLFARTWPIGTRLLELGDTGA